MIFNESINTNKERLQSFIQEDFDFEKIYHLYWKKVFGVAYYHLHSKHLAENIVQEVFGSLWRRQTNKNEPIRNIHAWLASAAKYAILSEKAMSNKHRAAALNEETGPVTENAMDLLFIEQMIAKEVNRLPRKCKLVFQYSRQNNLPNKEIAKRLDVSEKTVEKHITTALQKLRARMRDFFLF